MGTSVVWAAVDWISVVKASVVTTSVVTPSIGGINDYKHWEYQFKIGYLFSPLNEDYDSILFYQSRF